MVYQLSVAYLIALKDLPKDTLYPIEMRMEDFLPEKLIKSKARVQKHGEVFTPLGWFRKMLNAEGVKEACENLTTTFLEPVAGEGNFLVAILKRN